MRVCGWVWVDACVKVPVWYLLVFQVSFLSLSLSLCLSLLFRLAQFSLIPSIRPSSSITISHDGYRDDDGHKKKP